MIVITGGGTGGHLSIAKAIKDELNKRGIKPIFVGSTKGQDQKWFGDKDGWEEVYFFETSGVVNKRGLSKLFSLFVILKYAFFTRKIFKKHKIDKVFSVGGYSSASASFGALLFGKKLFIHEQNAKMGKLNKILAPFAKRVFCTFLYGDPYPIRDEFFDTAYTRQKLKTIIFLGGSQGAKAINDFAFEVAKTKQYKIIHQTGKLDYDRCKEFYEKNGLDVEFFDFDMKLANRLVKADLAVSRAGASTLFELVSNRLPSIFVPYPYAAGNHQYYNAKFLVDKKVAFLKKQEELCVDMFENIGNLEKISIKLQNINHKNGSKYIVDEIYRA